ncbi:hypothetical protein [Deinococcus aquaedulcis]|uniref:hypothetical protein n=1 Tax=Deinococcus aquaedulcis TaxID=2840455 RepID=UPI001C82EBC6|nr:hypothetical protein [Deinococcus aquaedulcis]
MTEFQDTEPQSRYALVRDELNERLQNEGVQVTIPDRDEPGFLDFMASFQATHPAYARRLTQALHEEPDAELPRASTAPSKVTFKDRVSAVQQKLFMRPTEDGDYVWDKRKAGTTALTSALLLAGGYLMLSTLPAKKVQDVAMTETVQTSTTTVEAAPGTKAAGTGAAAAATEKTPSTDDAFLGEVNKDTAPKPLEQLAGAEPTAEGIPANPNPPAEPFDVPPSSPTVGARPSPPPAFQQVGEEPFSPVASAPAPVAAAAPIPEPVATPAPTSVAPAPVVAQPAESFDPFANVSPAPTPAPATPRSTPARSTASTPPVRAVASTKAPAPVATPPESAFDPFGGAVTVAAPTPAAQPTGASTPIPTAAPSPVDVPASSEVANTPRQAVVYQATRQEGNPTAQAQPRSALVVTARAAGGQDATPGVESARSGLLQAQARTAPSRSAVMYTRAAPTGMSSNGTGSAGAGTELASAPAPQTAPSTGGSAEGAPVAASSTAPAPFAPTQMVAVRLVTSIYTPSGQPVPVVAQGPEGNFVGRAVLNASLARVEMEFTTYVRNGQVFPVQALAYQDVKGNLVSGVQAAVKDVAPNLAADLLRSGVGALNTYAQQLTQASTTTITNGTVVNTKAAPSLVTVLRGELGKVFALPENQQSFVTVGQVPTGTPFVLLFGLGETKVQTP